MLTSAQFYIDENTGTVYSKTANIDYEQSQFYMLSVQVRDNGGRTSQLQARVCRLMVSGTHLGFQFRLCEHLATV